MRDTYLIVMIIAIVTYAISIADSRKVRTRFRVLIEFLLTLGLTVVSMACIVVTRALLMYNPFTVPETLIVGGFVGFATGTFIAKISDRL